MTKSIKSLNVTAAPLPIARAAFSTVPTPKGPSEAKKPQSIPVIITTAPALREPPISGDQFHYYMSGLVDDVDSKWVVKHFFLALQFDPGDATAVIGFAEYLKQLKPAEQDRLIKKNAPDLLAALEIFKRVAKTDEKFMLLEQQENADCKRPDYNLQVTTLARRVAGCILGDHKAKELHEAARQMLWHVVLESQTFAPIEAPKILGMLQLAKKIPTERMNDMLYFFRALIDQAREYTPEDPSQLLLLEMAIRIMKCAFTQKPSKALLVLLTTAFIDAEHPAQALKLLEDNQKLASERYYPLCFYALLRLVNQTEDVTERSRLAKKAYVFSKKCLELDPGNPSCITYQSNFLLIDKKFAESLKLAGQLSKVPEELEGTRISTQIVALSNQTGLLDKEQIALVKKILPRARELGLFHPQDAKGVQGLRQDAALLCVMAKVDPKWGLPFFQMNAETDPYPGSLALLAHCLTALGEYDEAVKYYVRLINDGSVKPICVQRLPEDLGSHRELFIPGMQALTMQLKREAPAIAHLLHALATIAVAAAKKLVSDEELLAVLKELPKNIKINPHSAGSRSDYIKALEHTLNAFNNILQIAPPEWGPKLKPLSLLLLHMIKPFRKESTLFEGVLGYKPLADAKRAIVVAAVAPPRYDPKSKIKLKLELMRQARSNPK
jgi:tetratricopeptide (TPR) repeat protein